MIHFRLQDFYSKGLQSVCLGCFELALGVPVEERFSDIVQEGKGQLLVDCVLSHAEDQDSTLMGVVEVKVLKLQRFASVWHNLLKYLHGHNLKVTGVISEISKDDAPLAPLLGDKGIENR